MKSPGALFIFGLLFSLYWQNPVQAQERCGTVPYMQMLQSKDSLLTRRLANAEKAVQVRIKSRQSSAGPATRVVPVVVHILWHELYQNLCDDVIQSQIDVLNEDYSRKNADTIKTPVPFKPLGADAEIRFVLANRDPYGNVTNGIVRSYADSAFFNFGSDMKFDSTGGQDQWDPNQYLNIWVCNLANSVLGYATLPSGSINPGEDGVVVATKAFGRHGYDPSGQYNRGRTVTHEVGHWLDLVHIWGDDSDCNQDDYVDDTPIQADQTFECPSFPQKSCGNGPDGDMFMNYMDYTDDACMNIFTIGQIARMQAALDTLRTSILTSSGFIPDSANPIFVHTSDITVAPNPFKTSFNIIMRLKKVSDVRIEVFDLFGKLLFEQKFPDCFCETYHVDMSTFTKGIYFARIKTDQETLVTKLFLSK